MNSSMKDKTSDYTKSILLNFTRLNSLTQSNDARNDSQTSNAIESNISLWYGSQVKREQDSSGFAFLLTHMTGYGLRSRVQPTPATDLISWEAFKASIDWEAMEGDWIKCLNATKSTQTEYQCFDLMVHILAELAFDQSVL